MWSLNPPCLLFVPHRNSGWPLGSNPGTGSLMLLVTLRLNQKWRIFEKLFPFLNPPFPLFIRHRNPGQQLGLSVKTGSSKPISWYLQMRLQGLTFEKKSSKPERFSFSQISIYRDASFIVFFSFAIDVIEKVSRFGKIPHFLRHFVCTLPNINIVHNTINTSYPLGFAPISNLQQNVQAVCPLAIIMSSYHQSWICRDQRSKCQS